jgi:L-2-amino-thiazoline-4-carboxylic acid hydrolase-like protein
MEDALGKIPFIEQTKIQAQVLVPLIETLQAELGEERAKRIVRKALGGWIRNAAERMAAQVPGTAIDKIAGAVPYFAAGDAIDVEAVKKTDTAFEFNVTGCRYAKFYKELGVPEIGFMLLCDLDYPMTEGFGAGLELNRTQTIMQGADHCDFRYALKKQEPR